MIIASLFFLHGIQWAAHNVYTSRNVLKCGIDNQDLQSRFGLWKKMKTIYWSSWLFWTTEDDAPEEIVGITLTPCISRKGEAGKIGAAAMTEENSPAPRKSPRASPWPFDITPALITGPYWNPMLRSLCNGFFRPPPPYTAKKFNYWLVPDTFLKNMSSNFDPVSCKTFPETPNILETKGSDC